MCALFNCNSHAIGSKLLHTFYNVLSIGCLVTYICRRTGSSFVKQVSVNLVWIEFYKTNAGEICMKSRLLLRIVVWKMAAIIAQCEQQKHWYPDTLSTCAMHRWCHAYAYLIPSLKARFMGPRRGPPGATRTQVGPCGPHEPCYQGYRRVVFP